VSENFVGRGLLQIGTVPSSVLVVALVIASTLLGDSMLYAVLPSQPDAWKLSIPAVGVLLSVNRLVRLLTNSLAAMAFERFGSAAPFSVAILLSVIVTLIYGWATAFVVLLIARLTWGACWSLLRLGGFWSVLNEATDDNRGFLMGVYLAIIRMGSVLGALIGAVLTDLFGHRLTLTLFAATMAVTGMFWFLSSRDQRFHQRDRMDVGVRVREGLVVVLTDRRLLVTGSGGLITGLVFSGLVTASLGFFLGERFGQEIAFAGVAVGVTSITGLLLAAQWSLGLPLAPLLGYLSDRFGRLPLISSGFMIGALGLTLLAIASSLHIILIGVLLAFVAAMALTVILSATAGDLAPPERRSAVMSSYVTFLDLGSALGPLIGLSFASLATLQAVYGSAAVVLLLAAVLFRRAFSGNEFHGCDNFSAPS